MLDYTRQTEWIDGRGVFLWLAFYFGGLGAGVYIVALAFDSQWGLLIGWLIAGVVKGGAHLLYLGKPLRFWRMVSRPNTSWVSRGIIAVMAFVLFGFLQLVLSQWQPGTVETVFKVLAGFAALAVAMYTGFVLNTVRSISFWDSPLLPGLFVAYAILGGFGMSIVLAVAGDEVELADAKLGSSVLLLVTAVLVAVYLWTAAARDRTGSQSVQQLVRGDQAVLFWGGVVVLGMVVPLTIAALAAIEDVPSGLLVAGVVSELIGGLALRYCVLKAGAYKPLFERPGPRSRGTLGPLVRGVPAKVLK
jgi:formate-dependent nitrite reductase membrane component NrfD